MPRNRSEHEPAPPRNVPKILCRAYAAAGRDFAQMEYYSADELRAGDFVLSDSASAYQIFSQAGDPTPHAYYDALWDYAARVYTFHAS